MTNDREGGGDDDFNHMCSDGLQSENGRHHIKKDKPIDGAQQSKQQRIKGSSSSKKEDKQKGRGAESSHCGAGHQHKKAKQIYQKFIHRVGLADILNPHGAARPGLAKQSLLLHYLLWIVLCVVMIIIMCMPWGHSSHHISDGDSQAVNWSLNDSQLGEGLNPPSGNKKPSVKDSTFVSVDHRPMSANHTLDNQDKKNIAKRLHSMSTVYMSAAATTEAQQSGHAIYHLDTIKHASWILPQGEFLHAVMESGINSQLLGLVRARVTEPGYSLTHERILIPVGSRLIGEYTQVRTDVQNRIMIIWQRIITPSGFAIRINSPGTDRLGRTGMAADAVNHHFWRRFGQAMLLSLLSAGSAQPMYAATATQTAAQYYQSSVSQSFAHAAQQSLQSQGDIKPTIRIDPGKPIVVFVAHDLDFSLLSHQK